MQAVEFETTLTGKKSLAVPEKAAKRLPASGRAKVIILFDNGDGDEAAWRVGAYEQFMSDDAAEDAIYDRFDKNR
jgi:hypothetical protein